MQFKIEQGMNQDILKTYPENHFDSIVTDPPYGIEFLGKDWDSNTGAVETWEQCYRVLKPGGYILAFSAARTYHHLATNIESVGFEIRDQLMWIYASGFPKAQDIGKAIQKRQGVEQTKEYKENIPRVGGTGTTDAFEMCKEETVCTSPEAQQWSGWKTALKPGHEPIVMARKPFKGSAIDNVLTHGVGALNIDATRIPFDNDRKIVKSYSKRNGQLPMEQYDGKQDKQYDKTVDTFNEQGRYPSNVMGDIPEYQKYFYCPKVSRAERHTGFEQVTIPTNPDGMYAKNEDGEWKDPGKGYHNVRPVDIAGNNHPTVKPVELMKYLVRLVTPKGGKVLDPFNGSGSTGMAAVEQGFDYTGCELDPEYVAIANKRITGWYKRTRPTNTYNNLFD